MMFWGFTSFQHYISHTKAIKGDNERLCAIMGCTVMSWIPPKTGFEPGPCVPKLGLKARTAAIMGSSHEQVLKGKRRHQRHKMNLYLFNPRTANHNNCHLLVILKVIFAFCTERWPRSDCSSSLIRVHTVCLYAKNRFQKFARIFSRQHNQATFSDAGFLGILRITKVQYKYTGPL